MVTKIPEWFQGMANHFLITFHLPILDGLNFFQAFFAICCFFIVKHCFFSKTLYILAGAGLPLVVKNYSRTLVKNRARGGRRVRRRGWEIGRAHV